MQFDVLDHGFVRVVDKMGSDAAVVQAARVSYGAGTTTPSSDRGLIRYLMSHRHTSPFEMCEIKLHVKLPIFVARQWIRHRTANVNEVSGRYSVLPSEFYVPELDQVCYQHQTNKQGRAEPIEANRAEEIQKYLRSASSVGFMMYDHMIKDHDLARETARIVLPLSTYTEWYWKIDIHNLLHFLNLRLDGHAQWEIRQYADVIKNILREWMPITVEAFENYVENAVTLTQDQLSYLLYRARGGDPLKEAVGLTSREIVAVDDLL